MWGWCSDLQAGPFVACFCFSFWGLNMGWDQDLTSIHCTPHSPNIYTVCTQGTWLLCYILAPASCIDTSFRLGMMFWVWNRPIHCVYHFLETPWQKVGSGDDNTSMVHTHTCHQCYVCSKQLAIRLAFGSSQRSLDHSFRMGMMCWGWSRAIHYIWRYFEPWYGMGSR